MITRPTGRERAPSAMVKADFVTGLVLIALGVASVVESLRMPRFEHLNIEPYTVPGLVPGALGAVILLLGSALFLRAARAGGWRLGTGGAARAWSADPGGRRLALSLALCLGYAGLLVGRLPFWLATFIFVLGFVVLFEWLAAAPAARIRRVLTALVYALVVAAAVTLVFQHVFLVRLP
ncbi:MAG TPA: tripartite tricarboxylate transporter TctB family protein [Geminicoccaceae bacterium]|nr:tripartite tricarboxylate transporter TctB family protein [Geminicoccaceae bacterium]